jgi:hypothetical protein
MGTDLQLQEDCAVGSGQGSGQILRDRRDTVPLLTQNRCDLQTSKESQTVAQ